MMSLIHLAAFLIVNYTFWYIFKRLNLNAGHYILFMLGLFVFIFIIALFC